MSNRAKTRCRQSVLSCCCCVCVCSWMKDERNQVLIAYLWIRQTWHDAYLKWNKEDYDGLDVIHIPSNLVWRPDLVLYNKYVSLS